MTRKYAAEVFGTFALVFAGTVAVVIDNVSHGAVTHVGVAITFVLEVVLTAYLMFVIFNVSTGPKEVGVMAGIAIGGVIGLEAMFARPICGASMNPIRSLAPAVVSGHITSLWVYLTAPVIGAAVAVPCWRLTRDCPDATSRA